MSEKGTQEAKTWWVGAYALEVPVAEVYCTKSFVDGVKRIDCEWVGAKRLPVAVSLELLNMNDCLTQLPWSMVRGATDATTGISYWFRLDGSALYRHWWIARYWALRIKSCLGCMMRARR